MSNLMCTLAVVALAFKLRRRWTMAVLVAALCLTVRANAASVNAGSGYTNSFELQPVAADWSTYSAVGSASDNYDMDTDVNANLTADLVVAPTLSDPEDPPAKNGAAMWSSSGLYLLTRPTGNRYTVLMGQFVNNTKTNATQLTIGYLLTLAGEGIPEDSGQGTRVYFSLTGEAGSWTNVPALNTTASADGTTPMSASVDVDWPDGANLYVVWVDDNAAGFGDDVANEIDNFSLQVTAGMPVAFACLLDEPGSDAVFVAGSPVSTAVRVVSGTAPYTVEYFTNSGIGNDVFASAGSSATPPYTIELADLPAGNYGLYAVATDSAETPATAVSATNTFLVADPLAVTLAEPEPDASFDHNVVVPGMVIVAGGLPPYSVQFFLDDVADGEPVIETPYEHSFGPLFVGDHTVQATVTDALGWGSNSPMHTIHITGPLAAILSPEDGTIYSYGEAVSLSAFVGGGAAPYTATFYTNDLPVGTLHTPPFATNLGILPVGSYTSYVHATDSSLPDAQQANSTSNVITILPNPLAATLTSPNNGQNIATNAGFTARATVSVALPVTVDNVEFFLDELSLGTVSTAPYTLVVPAIALGSHTIHAVATDSLGRITSTATNQVAGVYDPLANDNFNNRITLVGPVASATGSNNGATTENREPTGSFFQGYGATLWWSWTAPISGTVRIDTFGSSFNTSLGVYTGNNVSNLRQVAFNDNAPGSSDVSLVTFNVEAGTQYQIQIGGMRNFGFPPPPPATGTIELHLEMPPSVTLTEPANNSVFMTGDEVTLSATASSPHAAVVTVDFYSGELFLGTSTNEPYSVTANNLPAGTNHLYAVVTDGIGLSATSAIVNVAVFNVGMTLVSPADGDTFLNANPITLRAVAVLPSGTITNVEFLVNGETVGEDNTEPYSTVWGEVTPGLHRLSARGTDELGNTYLSTLVWIAVAEPVVSDGSDWKYLDDGSDQGTNWFAAAFDDRGWSNGPAQLGYGDGDETTVVSFGPEENNKYITTYFRRAFVVENAASFSSLTLSLLRDDGGVVYLNGKEVFRTDNLPPAPEPITYTTLATGFGVEDTVDTVTLNIADLVAGTNLLAVEIHQQAPDSSDLSFDLQLLGLPEIIRNQLPVIQFLQVADGDWFFNPAQIVLDVEASDPDGTVTNLSLFEGNTLLATSTNALTFQVNGRPPGIYHFAAVATDNGGAHNTKPITVTVFERTSGWVAYNDHYAGPNTHPYASAWNAFGTADGAPGEEGILRNIASGQPVSAFLSVFALGAMGDPIFGAPPSGTPAYDIFNSYIDFGSGGANHAIVLNRESVVFHFFSGLDPNRRYNFRGTAVGGVADFKNRWTLFAIIGARAFTAAHTANVLTSTTSPGALYPDEAAMNTGDNSTGDVVGWDDIAPGVDGTFTIVSTLYQGPAPGNDPPGPYAYAPVAVRLEEVGAKPYIVLTEPHEDDFFGFTDLEIAATASSVAGITNVQFLANGALIGTDATSPYSMVWTDAAFGVSDLTAVAFDASGLQATSPVFTVIITPPLTNTIAPVVAVIDPPRGATLAELTTIEVTFSEDVYGVDAADLLVNGTPAIAVNGNGSNYTFTVTPPGPGSTYLTWSPAHGITDKGYPASLPFDQNGAGARWSYTIPDNVAPTVLALDPPVGASVTNLSQITVVFSEPVVGVDAADLLVRNAPATGVAGFGSTYTFIFPPPPYGLTIVRWASNHGITDQATPANAFAPSPPTWTYVVNANSVLIQTNSAWRLLRGLAEASAPSSAWREPGFDASSWDDLPAPMFYGDPYESYNQGGSLLSDMREHYSSLFLRKEFQVTKALSITNLLLKAQSDDGFIAWINGVEVYRYNVSLGDLPYYGTALSEVAETAPYGAATVIYALPDPFGYLHEGTNVLAIQAFNYAATNDDFNFDAQLNCYRYNSSLVAPGVIRVNPPAGSRFDLTNVTVTFNEPVSGVDAADFLVNGVPATFGHQRCRKRGLYLQLPATDVRHGGHYLGRQPRHRGLRYPSADI